MELHFLSAAAVGIALVAVSPADDAPQAAAGPLDLVGAQVFASETHIDRWGAPVRAEDVALEDLGIVARVVTPDAGDGSGVLLVSVGGLWGWGAQEVEVEMERLHLLDTAAGGQRLVVDLSPEGAEPVSG